MFLLLPKPTCSFALPSFLRMMWLLSYASSLLTCRVSCLMEIACRKLCFPLPTLNPSDQAVGKVSVFYASGSVLTRIALWGATENSCHQPKIVGCFGTARHVGGIQSQPEGRILSASGDFLGTCPCRAFAISRSQLHCRKQHSNSICLAVWGPRFRLGPGRVQDG